MTEKIEILATEKMSDMAERVYQQLSGVSYSEAEYITFKSGEVKVKVPETVRGKDVYLFHSLYHDNPNDGLMKLLLTNDALARSGARSINLMLPYMTYLRQDRQDEPGVPISAKLMANLIEANPKVEKIVSLDMHCAQAQGFYDREVQNLPSAPVQVEYFRREYAGSLEDVVVVSPDFGGSKRARKFANCLDGREDIGVVEKQRSGKKSDKVKSLLYIGPDVAGKTVVIYDDMIDTGGTLISAAKMLMERGAAEVYAVATHGVFSRVSESTTAEQRLRDSGMKVVVTESIPRSKEYCLRNKDWLISLPLDKYMAEAVGKSAQLDRDESYQLAA